VFDLGSSINTMDLSTFQQIKGLEVQIARIKIGFENGKTTRPYRMVEDVVGTKCV